MTPLVTVYITNFNYGKYIKQAIESVLNQSFQDFEIIIIDDGSTDNSKQIIESFSHNSKIQVIFQQNKGLNVTNNIALRVAQGRYIMRLDADDYLEKNALELMSEVLEKDAELGLVFPDYYMVDASGDLMNIEKRHSFEKEVSLLDQPAHGACTMIRKKFLQSLGGYDEQFKCQDGYDLWIRFTAKFKVTNINTPLFYYRQHGENLTSNENRILDTRAAIKEKFIANNISNYDDAIAIIPIRGAKYDSKNVAFIELNGKKVVDLKIEQALKAEKIKHIVISSPDETVGEYIAEKYPNNSKIIFHKRPEEFARHNTSLAETVAHVIQMDELKHLKIEIIVLLSVEFPFIKTQTIEDAINTIRIFKTDSLISVRQEMNTFFQHDGSGMKPILNQENFTKLEREALYKNTGGIIAVNREFFDKNKSLISGTVGHIVVDQISSLKIQTKLDLEIAEFIARK